MDEKQRLHLVFLLFVSGFIVIFLRLIYWQLIRAAELKSKVLSQYRFELALPSQRGRIITADNQVLVANQPAFLVYANKNSLRLTGEETAERLAPVLAQAKQNASDSAVVEEEIKSEIENKLNDGSIFWSVLAKKITAKTKEAIEREDIDGIGFERQSLRFYPEASTAAHLLGFVAEDINGEDKGYFGLEGFYDLELKGRGGRLFQETDAQGRPILLGDFKKEEAVDGYDLRLNLNGSMQLIVEEELKEALEHYGAKKGGVIVMDPMTGAILAMTSLPGYEPAMFSAYDRQWYKNPLVAETYEPGSTFKIIIMAAAIDAEVIKPETEVDESGPVQIGSHQIKTWNNQYHGRLNMTQVIEKSSNVGMALVAKELGKEALLSYFNKFSLGQLTGIDLEEEVFGKLREEWREIDLVTASFGQGIALTPIQMIRAGAVIANGGKLIKPQVVKQIITPRELIDVKTKDGRQVIESKSAKIVAEMMVNAVDNGEAKWAKPKGFSIAGKTGTAQIPVAGHYDEEKTIASFIGFAPAYGPKFIMLVTLQEPTSSPWGSETAAPLFFSIAKKLFRYYGISPR